MKYAWLAVVAAGCSAGWRHKTPELDPEPDSVTEYTREPPSPAPQAPPTAIPTTPCASPAHATAAGISLEVANASTFAHDLCRAVDQSLGLLPGPQSLGGFEIDVTLHEVTQHGARVKCRVSVRARTPNTIVGVFDQVATALGSSTRPADLEANKRDCVDVNIDDLVRQRAVPAIKRHAGMTMP